MATPGCLPVSNHPARRAAMQRMPGARRDSHAPAWAEPSSRFTARFEALAIEWLKAASQKAVAGLLRVSWDEIHGIMERAVQRGPGTAAMRTGEPVGRG